MKKLKHFIRWLLSSVRFNTDDADEEPPEDELYPRGGERIPPTVTNTSDPDIEIRLYQSSKLTRKNGRAPSQTAAKFIAYNLDLAGVTYRIDFRTDRLDVPEEMEVTNPHGTGVLGWFREQINEPAKDANILLMDIGGGGVTFFCGNYSAAAAQNIDRIADPVPSGDNEFCSHVNNVLHELAHALCGEHEDEMIPSPRLVYTDRMQKVIRYYAEHDGTEIPESELP